jgi:hypothetical protein
MFGLPSVSLRLQNESLTTARTVPVVDCLVKYYFQKKNETLPCVMRTGQASAARDEIGPDSGAQ